MCRVHDIINMETAEEKRQFVDEFHSVPGIPEEISTNFFEIKLEDIVTRNTRYVQDILISRYWYVLHGRFVGLQEDILFLLGVITKILESTNPMEYDKGEKR